MLESGRPGREGRAETLDVCLVESLCRFLPTRLLRLARRQHRRSAWSQSHCHTRALEGLVPQHTLEGHGRDEHSVVAHDGTWDAGWSGERGVRGSERRFQTEGRTHAAAERKSSRHHHGSVQLPRDNNSNTPNILGANALPAVYQNCPSVSQNADEGASTLWVAKYNMTAMNTPEYSASFS